MGSSSRESFKGEGFDHLHRSPGGLPPWTKKSHFMLEIDGDSTYSNEP